MTDLGGKSYRLVQNNLDKDIVPDKSSFLVKKDKVVIKLQKVRTGTFRTHEPAVGQSRNLAKAIQNIFSVVGMVSCLMVLKL